MQANQMKEVGKPTKQGLVTMQLITVQIPTAILEGLDDAVRKGLTSSRAEALRDACRDLLKFHGLWKETTE